MSWPEAFAYVGVTLAINGAVVLMIYLMIRSNRNDE
jgi:hypothetical protein